MADTATPDAGRHYKWDIREMDDGQWRVTVVRVDGDIAIDAVRRSTLATAVDAAFGATRVDRSNLRIQAAREAERHAPWRRALKALSRGS